MSRSSSPSAQKSHAPKAPDSSVPQSPHDSRVRASRSPQTGQSRGRDGDAGWSRVRLSSKVMSAEPIDTRMSTTAVPAPTTISCSSENALLSMPAMRSPRSFKSPSWARASRSARLRRVRPRWPPKSTLPSVADAFTARRTRARGAAALCRRRSRWCSRRGRGGRVATTLPAATRTSIGDSKPSMTSGPAATRALTGPRTADRERAGLDAGLERQSGFTRTRSGRRLEVVAAVRRPCGRGGAAAGRWCGTTRRSRAGRRRHRHRRVVARQAPSITSTSPSQRTRWGPSATASCTPSSPISRWSGSCRRP